MFNLTIFTIMLISAVHACTNKTIPCMSGKACCTFDHYDNVVLYIGDKVHLIKKETFCRNSQEKVCSLSCSDPFGKCISRSDCCITCTGVTCYMNTCQPNACNGPGALCRADCECCSGSCLINDITPGACQ